MVVWKIHAVMRVLFASDSHKRRMTKELMDWSGVIIFGLVLRRSTTQKASPAWTQLGNVQNRCKKRRSCRSRWSSTILSPSPWGGCLAYPHILHRFSLQVVRRWIPLRKCHSGKVISRRQRNSYYRRWRGPLRNACQTLNPDGNLTMKSKQSRQDKLSTSILSRKICIRFIRNHHKIGYLI